MKTVSAREANHGLSSLISEVERGEEIIITKHGRPVAVLKRYEAPEMTAEKQAAIDHAVEVMLEGLPWEGAVPRLSREEMHER